MKLFNARKSRLCGSLPIVSIIGMFCGLGVPSLLLRGVVGMEVVSGEWENL